LSPQALQGTNFIGMGQLREAIDAFIRACNRRAAPFEWMKATVTQPPMRRYIAYFRK